MTKTGTHNVYSHARGPWLGFYTVNDYLLAVLVRTSQKAEKNYKEWKAITVH